MYLKGRNGYFFKSFCQIFNYRNLKMCDVRLNDNIKRTSGINLEGPSLIRRSQKVWDPPKKWSNCAYAKNIGVNFKMFLESAHQAFLTT